MTSLQIIKGRGRNLFTLGYVVAGKAFRDERFSPVLKYYEAFWLLGNERSVLQRERTNPQRS